MRRSLPRRVVSTDSFPLIVLMTVTIVAVAVTVSLALVSGKFDRQVPADGGTRTETVTTSG